MKYTTLLFDADNTILDFDKSEERALKIALEQNGIEFDYSKLEVYRKNNIYMWELLEQCKVTKQEVLFGRFDLTAKELGWDVDVNNVAEVYEKELHNGFFVIDGAEQLVRQLIEQGYKLYIVTNGVLSIQQSRMKGSGMGKYFIKHFVSEEIGYPKPQKEYFDYCFANIQNFDKSKTLLIGDSLTSDIQGGINAGIDTCWYNPHNKANKKNFSPTYQIENWQQLCQILEQ